MAILIKERLCELQATINAWKNKIKEINSLSLCEESRGALLGKKGLITQELKNLSSLNDQEKREIGSALNALKDELEELFAKKKKEIENADLLKSMEEEQIDVTLTSRPESRGLFHLLTQVMREVTNFFKERGFEVFSGPEIDSDFYNFEALNFPDFHPARQEQDTFYIKGFEKKLLRTHTSTMQIRTFLERGVPIRGISIGSTFRNDAVDATHMPMFHQIEVFCVEPGITVAHMKHCLLEFLGFLFNIDLCGMVECGEKIPVRFRPSFFPFTEPSLEVDACCLRTDGELKLDLEGNWLELLGCGMIHPNVFKNSGLTFFENGDSVQGFAAGIGVERIAMLKYGLTDIRNFYDGNLRWLKHYGSLR